MLAKKQTPNTSRSEQSYSLDLVNLAKTFKRHTRAAGYSTIKSSLLSKFIPTKKNLKLQNLTRAVQDLTIRIPRGASLGIIGRNGSGKSTLLKLITGIYKPDSGTISVNGRIAALIELGAGFHPDFTGRENVYLAGAMHGLGRKQIDAKFESIVQFAELEQVIDDPVRTYSSGMFMRLGFSLAIHTEPDVLIVDEVLAVGDAAFVVKCKEKISDLRSQGKTLLLVTHDLDAVERWCDEVLWLDKGQVKDRGEPRRVIDAYRQFIEKGEESQLFDVAEASRDETQSTNTVESETSPEDNVNSEDRKGRWGSREVEIKSVRMLNSSGEEHLLFHPEDSLKIEINYHFNELVPDVVFGIGIKRNDGLLVHGSNTQIEEVELKLNQTEGRLFYEIQRLGLLDGEYYLDIAVHRRDGYPYDYQRGVLTFAVRNPLAQVGVCVPKHTWSQVGA